MINIDIIQISKNYLESSVILKNVKRSWNQKGWDLLSQEIRVWNQYLMKYCERRHHASRVVVKGTKEKVIWIPLFKYDRAESIRLGYTSGKFFAQIEANWRSDSKRAMVYLWFEHSVRVNNQQKWVYLDRKFQPKNSNGSWCSHTLGFLPRFIWPCSSICPSHLQCLPVFYE